ncbi:MAG: hypothetical protein ACR2NW_08225 [Thermodesulfobacteriota bacterium]
MPLYEFECIKCRSNLEDSLKIIEKKRDKKTVTDLVNKHENINVIEVVDLKKNKILAKYGKKGEKSVFMDFYQDEGNILILFNLRNYRFSELIYEPEDEKRVKCYCGEKKKIEKVISSFAFTSDLSTDMPQPDFSNLPPSVRQQTSIGEYIEEKDRPKKNR